MDSHNSTGNATNHATAGKRKRSEHTLTRGVNDGGAGPSVCCPCVNCDHCECHDLAEALADATYLDSLPVGYRFNPTDKELIVHYLSKKLKNETLPRNKINEAYIYGDYHPKDIVVHYPQAVEGEWYFFTSRNRKYVHGKRPSRKAGPGYWKATGPDKEIKHNGTKIGGRKSLVYHEGRPPKGTKTEWMMHEYVFEGNERIREGLQDMKLDDYVLCKIYTKKESARQSNEDVVNDQQARVENVVTDAREQVMVHDQQARLVSNVRSNQSLNPAIRHVENNSSSMDRQVMVPDHPARVFSNQVINPTSFQVENNNAVRSNQSLNSTNQYVENRLPSMDRQVMMVPDQQTNMRPLHDLITPYSRSFETVQRTGFPKITAPPFVRNSSLTPFNNNYSMPSTSHLPPTPRRSAPQPPRMVDAPREYVRVTPEMYLPGPSSNSPRLPFEEGNECDGDAFMHRNIENIIWQDGNEGLSDIFPLSYSGNEQLDFDESIKKQDDEQH